MRRSFPLTVDMDEVRALHAQGYKLKQIAFALGIAYNTLASRTAAAGLRFRNHPHKAMRPKAPPNNPLPMRSRVAPPKPVEPSAQDLTRTILDLHEAWEREMRADLKAELAQQIRELRA